MRKLQAVSPGELLKEEFLDPMGISQYRLAKEIEVPAQRNSLGEAFCVRRYRSTTLQILWTFQRLLASSPSSIRYRDRRR